jgi:Mn2+/Fe2+ NRAMP family transporter
MADATEMVTGLPSWCLTPLYAILIAVLMLFSSYRTMARVFKWLTLVLFAYVMTAFVVHPDWTAVIHATFVPRIKWSSAYLSVLVALFGTTISPYLFFWQAAQEVEEERAIGRVTVAQRKGATADELSQSRYDVLTGMFFSNFVMFFIILTTASTLNAHGVTHISTSRQAAEALRPLAGAGAYWLFTLGLIGTGLLGVPVLAGSSAYAISEAMAWTGSLDRKPALAPKFYAVLGVAMALGLTLDFARLDAVKMLFWSAVANGVLAPPLVVIVVLLTTDSGVMGEHVNSPLLKWLGWITALVMTAAAIAMFVTA